MPPSHSDRNPAPGVLPLFAERWSPRAFSEHTIDEATMTRLIDAARWSPSCFNAQPWRFFTSDPTTFSDYLELLVDANQEWAATASVLGFLIGKKHFEHDGSPNPSYVLDCGAAWMAMTLQARHEGLYTHGMAGIKHQQIIEYFDLDPEHYSVVLGFAVGKLGDPSQLSAGLREREHPSPRKPLTDIWCSG